MTTLTAPRYRTTALQPPPARSGSQAISPVAPVFAIILAGGQSRRFGGDKLGVAFLGRPLLAHVVHAVQAAERDGTVRASWVVVPGPEASAARIAASLGASIVSAPHAGQGIGWSIRAGIEAIAASAPAGPAAVLIVPGDQPRLRPEVLATLARRWRATGAGVVRPRYAAEPDVPGHPVLLDRSRWGDLAALAGDRGLRATGGDVEYVDVPGSNPDIDTRRDLAEQAGKEPD